VSRAFWASRSVAASCARVARAQTRIDELIGLQDAKEQIALWRTEIQIDQLLAAQGDAVRSAAPAVPNNSDNVTTDRISIGHYRSPSPNHC
jgi:hypothetical protein